MFTQDSENENLKHKTDQQEERTDMVMEFEAGKRLLEECEESIFEAEKTNRKAAKSIVVIIQKQLWRFSDIPCKNFDDYIYNKGFDRSYVARLRKYAEFLAELNVSPELEPSETSVRPLLTNAYRPNAVEIYKDACERTRERKKSTEERKKKNEVKNRKENLTTPADIQDNQTQKTISEPEDETCPNKTLNSKNVKSVKSCAKQKDSEPITTQPIDKNIAQGTSSGIGLDQQESQEQEDVIDIIPTPGDIREALEYYDINENTIFLKKMDVSVDIEIDIVTGLLQEYGTSITSAAILISTVKDFRRKREEVLSEEEKTKITSFLEHIHAEERRKLLDAMETVDTSDNDSENTDELNF